MRAAAGTGRAAGLFRLLDSLGLDSAILDDRNDVFYFTGFTGSDAAALFSAKRRRVWLVTDARYREEAERSAPGAETLLWRNGFPAFLGRTLARLGLRRPGFTPATLRVAFFDILRRESGIDDWLDIGPGKAGLRAVKDADEIAAMEKAVACAEAAFSASRRRWRAGMAEMEVKNDLEWEMRRRGAEDAAFETIVAAGSNASLPHAHAGNGKIRPGGMLLVDFGARVGRYNSDLTRTLWAGEAPKVWRRRYQAVQAAHQAGIRSLRAGRTGRAAFAAARRELVRAGLGKRFDHALGHGVGLAIHEDPKLGPASARPLESGNVVTVEPGAYFPGVGGVRLEDMVLILANGCRVMSSLPRDLDELVF